ncbi:MAG: FAD-dependent oxidoreductase [Candidatus Aminicenantes bacterium]|nr:FAD-dependent oxidoreductase [Candidatus Aminicenantes bacterium]
MKKNYDIAVIGAGIIGMATAYYLSQSGLKTAVIEKKYIGSGSTGRCISGIRQQFSTPTSIGIMKESISLFSQMEEEFGFSVDFKKNGYLLMAHNQDLLNTFQANIDVQRKEGVNVSLLGPQEAQSLVPALNIQALLGAAYCPDDGQAYPFSVLKGYKNGIDENKGDFYLYDPVQEIQQETHFLLTLQSGTLIEADKILLCAGPWTRELGQKLGLDLPFYPERHEAIITERTPKVIEPMLVDYRKDGCYFQQLLTGQIIGCYTPDPNVPGIRQDSSLEFLLEMAQRMIRLIPELKKAAILRHWAGCYTMTPDGNPIVDQTPVDNCYVASGMSGHGFMFGPGICKHLAHYMVHDKWDSDFSEFSINRTFQSKESLK